MMARAAGSMPSRLTVGVLRGADFRDGSVTSRGHCRRIHRGTEAGSTASALLSFSCVCHLWLPPLQADAGHCGRYG